MSTPFIGVDAGGTRTRALVATPAGEILGAGRAGGANVWSSGAAIAPVVGDAMRKALGSLDPATVGGGVIAMAGAGTASAIVAEVEEAWRSLGLPGSPHLVTDVVAAYYAGTHLDGGAVLVSGTGSIAAVIEDGEIARRVGGHGWLLGDEGSAVWLGIGALRATLRALDGRGPATVLASAIPPALGIEERDAAEVALRIVAETHGRAPAELGRLAHTVVEAANEGDAEAQGLVESGSGELVEILAAAVSVAAPEIVVLAGSLLTGAGPLASQVRVAARARWPGIEIVQAASGEVGAVALAVSRATGHPTTRALLARLWDASSS